MSIIGHKNILDFLDGSIASRKISHGYIFSGPAHIGKLAVAREFAKKLNGLESIENHPDVNIIQTDEKIKIDQVRELIHVLSLSPYNAKHKIAIIDNAELFTNEAANALLKTLEEPSPSSILILITSDLKRVLPTLISRCQIVRFYPVSGEELLSGLALEGLSAPDEILMLAAGRPGIALRMIEEKEFYKNKQAIVKEVKSVLAARELYKKFELAKKLSEREDILSVLEEWVVYFREKLMYRLSISQKTFIQSQFSLARLRNIIAQIVITKNLLRDTNANLLLVLENLLLELEN